jgi:cyclophilin family peptidyl-prolyl cis-trans isomerase
MKRLLIIGTMLALGVGCAPAKPAAPDAYAPPAKDLSQLTVPEPAPAESAAETPTPKPASTPEPKAMNETLKFPGVLSAAEISGKRIRIETSKGTIVFELFDKDAPKTVSNFVYLTKKGFYDGARFHRRVEGFVIQGGDPLSKDLSQQDFWGTGGPGYKFEDEPVKHAYDHGIVAMANSGPNTNGSQFFIMLADYPLDPLYNVFGKVVSGLDVVAKIKVGDVMTKVTVEDAK